uniref:Uncharacterized protein n=1 Tax=Photinus pyralis TaxID=7054 RepID=A0A1Y1K2B0_PHOPY
MADNDHSDRRFPATKPCCSHTAKRTVIKIAHFTLLRGSKNVCKETKIDSPKSLYDTKKHKGLSQYVYKHVTGGRVFPYWPIHLLPQARRNTAKTTKTRRIAPHMTFINATNDANDFAQKSLLRE